MDAKPIGVFAAVAFLPEPRTGPLDKNSTPKAKGGQVSLTAFLATPEPPGYRSNALTIYQTEEHETTAATGLVGRATASPIQQQ